MYKIGLSVVSYLATAEMFQNLKNAGFFAIEISHSSTKHLEYDNLPQFAAWAKQYGIDLWSYHLPFWDDNMNFISISDAENADATVKLFCDLIEQGVSVGIKNFVIHPSGEPIKDEDRSAHLKRARQSLRTLADFASKKGAVICVENLPRTCLGKNSEELLELISAHPALRVCFDTNHLLKESYVDFICSLKEKIVTTHISDYDFVDEKHWLPGEGFVDWGLLYHTLQSVGYDGVWLYELGFHNDKLPRSRDLTCEDFARNAKEIFEGTPIPTLLMKS